MGVVLLRPAVILKSGQVLVAIRAPCEDHKYAEMTMNDKGLEQRNC